MNTSERWRIEARRDNIVFNAVRGTPYERAIELLETVEKHYPVNSYSPYVTAIKVLERAAMENAGTLEEFEELDAQYKEFGQPA